MTTKRHGTDGGSGDGPRPRMKSSHERVFEGGAKAKPSKKPARGAPRLVAKRPPAPRPHPPAPTGPSAVAGLGAGPAQGPGARRRRVGGSAPACGAWRPSRPAPRATAIAVAALDKKAVGLEILDVAGKVDYADFLVLMTGRSDRHVAVARAGDRGGARRSRASAPSRSRALAHGNWVLMDFGDVVVHVFQDDARRLYDIEGLWLDARRLPVPADTPAD